MVATSHAKGYKTLLSLINVSLANPKKAQKDYIAAQSLSTVTILGGLGAGSTIFLILIFFVWYCKRRQYENNIKRRKVEKQLKILKNCLFFFLREKNFIVEKNQLKNKKLSEKKDER